MEYKGLIFSVLILVSCEPTKSIVEKSESGFKDEKTIKWFLKEESIIGTTYKKFELKKDKTKFYHKEKVIQIENDNYSYHYEIFDNNYILISIFNKPNIWSSPILIPKDSLHIYDLKKQKKSFATLKNTKFVLNKTELKNEYKTKVDLNEKFDYFFAIDSINLDTNELFLVDPNFKIVEYKLKSVN